MKHINLALILLFSFISCQSSDSDYSGGDITGGELTAVCDIVDGFSTEIPEITFVRNLQGQTSWYASPVVYDLDGDGKNELIAAYYNVYVFDNEFNLIATGEDGDSRVYAPHVVADLDGDGITEIVAGRGNEVYAWEYISGSLSVKAGWPANVSGDSGATPEVRGMSAGDLDGDGLIEIVVSTTQTVDEEDGGSQIYVFNSSGGIFQPAGGHSPAWPRYNALSGDGNDADRNGYGHHGYGCYGLNVAIGNIDDDDELEILATYDNHHIQAFKMDGIAIDSSPWFTNRSSEYPNERLTWGQFIRWEDTVVEENHYHLHEGEWPHPSWTRWLQWTATPPQVADIDGDGKNEVIGAPNVEMNEPYETQAYAIMVLNGNYGDGSESAMRKLSWEALPLGEYPIKVDGWYPPSGVPAIMIADILGNEGLEMVVSLNDGFMYCFSSIGEVLWKYNFRHNKRVMYSSEAISADLNGDGSPEIIFTTYGAPESESGYLIVLKADGTLVHDIPLPEPGQNGNGNGSPAAPGIGDLDGDGKLEIFVQTFDHGMDVFRVESTTSGCIPWKVARGGFLRKGQPD
ncbi:MAG: VCBS repeat-containing protein [Deltaproteobacteria bacterium]|nr:VCBS repeat-containing protein [Deltaproteobacteria bacterium]